MLFIHIKLTQIQKSKSLSVNKSEEQDLWDAAGENKNWYSRFKKRF